MKNNFDQVIWELQETLDKIEKIKKITDPEESVEQFNDELKDEYPFYQDRGYSGNFMSDFRYMEEGLVELKLFKKFLAQKGKL